MVASVSFLKICSTCVVATCDEIFVSILIDLIGRVRGKVMGRGGLGQRSHGPGTITPWAAAVAAIENNSETDSSNSRSFKSLMISSLAHTQKFTHLAQGKNGLPGGLLRLVRNSGKSGEF
jgi:hypothetical protein